MKKTTKKAIACVTTRAAAAAAICGTCKTLIPIPMIEVAPLTYVTMNMCKKIARIYGYDGLSGITALIGVATGAALGTNLASQVLTLVPGIGGAASALATAGLHLGTGAIMIVVFELMDEGAISKESINHDEGVLHLVNSLSGHLTTIVGKLFRGDLAGAMYCAKSAIDFSKPYITC